MTNEEAIESFKHSNKQAKVRLEVEKMRMDSGEIKELEFYIERNEMAIKALETIPKYKDAYNKGWDDGAKATYEHMKMCEEEQEPRWIPVSEMLPDNTDPVNITWVNHDPESYYADIKDKPFTATGHYCNGRWWWYSVTCQDYLDEYGRCDVNAMDDAIEVIAWMPLPKPYRAESEDKE